ncbi:hypothetical protein IT568_05995 [bacterium]|nr:hypothetical protein [bacterium]
MKKAIFSFSKVLCLLILPSLAQSQVTTSVSNIIIDVSTPSPITVPISTSDLTAQNITSYTINLNYNPSMIAFSSVSVNGTLSSTASTVTPTETVQGQLMIDATFPAAPGGSGTLLNLLFTLVNNTGFTVLDLETSMNAGLVSVTSVDGSLKINNLPVLIAGIPDFTLPEDTNNSTLFNLNNFFSDFDGDVLTFQVENSNATLLSFNVDGSKNFIVSASPDASGNANFVVTASDQTGTVSDTFQVTINPVNDAPFVFSPMQNKVVNEDATFFLEDLESVFSDVDNPSLTFSFSSTNQANIFVNLLPSNVPQITLGPNYNNAPNQDFLIVTATDSQNASVSDTISILIFPVNDPPGIVTPLGTRIVSEDTNTDPQLSIVLSNFLFSPDGDTLTFTGIENSLGFNLTLTGNYNQNAQITLAADYNNSPNLATQNPESIVFTATDKNGETVSDTLHLVILAVNDAPRANSYQNKQVLGNTASTVNTPPISSFTPLNIAFTDPETDAIASFNVASSNVTIATVTLDPISTIPTITLTPDNYGTVTITFTATDIFNAVGSTSFQLTTYNPNTTGPGVELLDGTFGSFFNPFIASALRTRVTELGGVDVLQNSVKINYYSLPSNNFLYSSFPFYTVTNGTNTSQVLTITDSLNFNFIGSTGDFLAEAVAYNAANDTTTASRVYSLDSAPPTFTTFNLSPQSVVFQTGLNTNFTITGTFSDGSGAGVNTSDLTFFTITVYAPNGTVLSSAVPTIVGNSFSRNITGINSLGTYTIVSQIKDRVGNTGTYTNTFVVTTPTPNVTFANTTFQNYFNPNTATTFSFTVSQLTAVGISTNYKMLALNSSNVVTDTLLAVNNVSATTSVVNGNNTNRTYSFSVPSGVFPVTTTSVRLETSVTNLSDGLVTNSQQLYILDDLVPVISNFTVSSNIVAKGGSVTLNFKFKDSGIGTLTGSGINPATVSIQLIRPNNTVRNASIVAFTDTSATATFNATQIPGNYNLSVSLQDRVGNIAQLSQNAVFGVSSTEPTLTFSPSDFNFFFNPNAPNNFNFAVSGLDSATTLTVKARVFDVSNLPATTLIDSMNSQTFGFTANSIPISYGAANINASMNAIRLEVTTTNNLDSTNVFSQDYLTDGFQPIISLFTTQKDTFELGNQVLFSATTSDALSGLNSSQITVLSPLGTLTNLLPPLGNFTNFPFNSTNVAGTYTATLNVSDNVGNSASLQKTFFVKDDSLQVSFLPADFGFYFNPQGINNFSFNAIKAGTSNLNSVEVKVYNLADSSLIESGIFPSFNATADTNLVNVSVSTALSSLDGIILEAKLTNQLGNTITRKHSYLTDSVLPTVSAFTVADTVYLTEQANFFAAMFDSLSGLNLSSFQLQVVSPNNTFNFNLTPNSLTNNLSNSFNFVFTNNNVLGNYNVTLTITDNVGNSQTSQKTYFVKDAPAPIINFSDADYLNFYNPLPPNIFKFSVFDPKDAIHLPQTNGIFVTVTNSQNGTVLQGPEAVSYNPNYFLVSDTLNFDYAVNPNLTGVSGVTVSVTATNSLGFSTTQTQSYVADANAPVVSNFTVNPNSIAFGQTTTVSANFSDVLSGTDSVFVRVLAPQSTSSTLFFAGFELASLPNLVFSNTQTAGTYQVSLETRDRVGNILVSNTSFTVTALAPVVTLSDVDFLNFFNPLPPNIFGFTVEPQNNVPLSQITVSVFDATNSGNPILLEGPNPPTTTNGNNYTYLFNGQITSSISTVRVSVTATNTLGNSATQTRDYTVDGQVPTVSNFVANPNSIQIGEQTTVSADFTDALSGTDSVFVRVLAPQSTSSTLIFAGFELASLPNLVFSNTQTAGTYQVSLETRDKVGNVLVSNTSFEVNANAPIVLFPTLNSSYFNPAPPNSFSFKVIKPQNVPLKTQGEQGIQIRVYNTATSALLETIFPGYTVSDTVNIDFEVSAFLANTLTEIGIEVTAINVLNDTSVVTQNYLPDFFAPSITLFNTSPDTTGIGGSVTINSNFNDTASGIAQAKITVIRPLPLNSLVFTETVSQSSFQVVFDSTQVAGNYLITLELTDKVGNVVTNQIPFVVKSSPPAIVFGSGEFNNFFNPAPPNVLTFSVIEKDNVPILVSNGIVYSIFSKPSGSLIVGPLQPVYTVSDTINFSQNIGLTIPQNDDAIEVRITVTNVLGFSNTSSQTFLIDSKSPTLVVTNPQANVTQNKNSTVNFTATFVDESSFAFSGKKQVSKVSAVGSGIDLSSVKLEITAPDGIKTDVTSQTVLSAETLQFLSQPLDQVGNYIFKVSVKDNVGNLSSVSRTIKINEDKPTLVFGNGGFGDFFNPSLPNTFTINFTENGTTQVSQNHVKINLKRVTQSGTLNASNNIAFGFVRNGNEVNITFTPNVVFGTNDLGMLVEFVLNSPFFAADTLTKIYLTDTVPPQLDAVSPQANAVFSQNSKVNIFFNFAETSPPLLPNKKGNLLNSFKGKNKISAGSGIDTSSIVFKLEFPDGNQVTVQGIVTESSFSYTTDSLKIYGNYAAILSLKDKVGNAVLLRRDFKVSKQVLPTTIPQANFLGPFTIGKTPHKFDYFVTDDEGISNVSLKVSRLRASTENPQGLLETIETNAQIGKITSNDTVFVSYFSQVELLNTNEIRDLELILETSVSDFEGNVNVVTQVYQIDQDAPKITGISPAKNSLVEALSNFTIRVDYEDAGIGILSAKIDLQDKAGNLIRTVNGSVSGKSGFAETQITEDLASGTYQIIFTASDSLGNSVREVSEFRINAASLEISDFHNFPNPFKIGETTTFVLGMTKDVSVTINIFDFSGRKVRTLVKDKTFQPQGGAIQIVPVWNGKNDSGEQLAKGVYFANLVAKETNGSTTVKQTIKVALIK